jgi:putative ABC transport system permease protein
MMRLRTLVSRNLRYFWRTNLAVVAGVATAVAVLAGALLVGDSVRGSLRDLFEQRIGKTDEIIASTSFFREDLSSLLQAHPRFGETFGSVCPLIVLNGLVIDDKTGKRASNVQVYGVDDRFWKFHELANTVKTPGDREALLSPDLASELGSEAGNTTLLRIEKPSAIPAGSLHGRKDDLGQTIRLTFREALAPSNLGEFSLRPGQGPVRAIFVSLTRLQRDLAQTGKANTILIANKSKAGEQNAGGSVLVAQILKETLSLEDLGIRLRPLDRDRGIALESETAMINESLYGAAVEAAKHADLKALPILSYLANSIRIADRDVPYSVVTAVPPELFVALKHRDSRVGNKGTGGAANSASSIAKVPELVNVPRIVLNEWAANDLGAKTGDSVTLEYYLWQDDGRLRTESAQFVLDGIVPLDEQSIDRDLVPDYPGLTETENIADWDPPFPVDLKRVRPRDEDYWHKYRTTPKAFIPLDAGIKLWQTRHGKFTSLRLKRNNGSDSESKLQTFKESLRTTIEPVEMGVSISAVRSEGLKASEGSTDFGEYFVYFSFFLVVGALLLASLFFKLGIEQRLREIGTLRAVGFSVSVVRSMFLMEGTLLSAAGSALGVVGALAYGELVMYGLRTWWVGAVGTTALTLHISALSLVGGALGGVVAAVGCILWTLRALRYSALRNLLTGSLEASLQNKRISRTQLSVRLVPILAMAGGVVLLVAASLNRIGKTAGFFGAGLLLLVGLLCFEYNWLHARGRRLIQGSGWWSVSKLGFRNATFRPGRSILCIALMSSAAFIIVAVDTFKRGSSETSLDKKSGTGGFPLVAETILPIYHDLNTDDGKEALSIVGKGGFDPDRVNFIGFRVRPGDDASCLNLYQPRNPRILGASQDFIKGRRFAFKESLAQTGEEKENAWLLLNHKFADGAIPVIADANSMTYVLHRQLGDEVVISGSDGNPLRLRLVATLSDSIFQSELLMSDENFLRLFPDNGGYGFYLLEVSPEASSATAGALEEQLADFGFDVTSTSERLASYHRVENTYLSTFQTLGGLGLVLGTLGMASVLLRNVLERRRELALLRAIGYNSEHFAIMVIAENAFLVGCGLVTGTVCALIAIGPAFISRGGNFPELSMWLLLGVLATGLLASLAATVAALRTPLLPSLRAE